MAEELPHAVPAARRHGLGSRWWWVLPVLAGLAVLIGVISALAGRGPQITISVPDAHGLKPGAAIKHRGMRVGVVEELRLESEDEVVVITARLEPSAADLARAGTRFWVARPILGAEGVSGMDTLLGGRHVAVLPGGGSRQWRFQGLATPPARTPELAGGLELLLESPRRGGLVQGAPVLYRQIEVGKVVGVNLASDGQSVQVHVVLAERYAELVRPQSRFWMVSGVDVEAGLFSGVEVSIDSLAALAQGGVAFATPEESGDAVATGHRFELHDGPDEDWLEWRPSLPVGRQLPGGVAPPQLERIAVNWRTGTLWKRDRRRNAWALPVAEGILLPGNVLAPLAEREEDASLEFAGQRVQLEISDEQVRPVARLRVDHGLEPLPRARMRVPESVEDVLLVCGDRDPFAVAAGRFQREGQRWTLPEGPVLDPSWHGAVAVSRRDGHVVGMVLVGNAQVVVVPFSAALLGEAEAPAED